MGRQKSFLKYAGTIGEVTHTDSEKGSYARKKAEFDPERLAKSPEFEGSRKAGTEFGRASKAGKLLRTALQEYLPSCSEPTVVNRLTKVFHNIVKSDPSLVKGERKVVNGNLQLLKNFEFNDVNKLGQKLRFQTLGTIDRASGSFTVSIPSFKPNLGLITRKVYNHYQFFVIAIDIDFESGTHKIIGHESELLPIVSKSTNPLELSMVLESGSQGTLMLALGISFFEQVGGKLFAEKGGVGKALRLIAVA